MTAPVGGQPGTQGIHNGHDKHGKKPETGSPPPAGAYPTGPSLLNQ